MSRKSIREEGFALDFYQVDGKDEWTVALNVFGMVKLRYGIELQGDYLLIRNIPWSNREMITGVRTAPLKSASLEAFPEAAQKQLPGLFAAAQEKSREASQRSLAYLYPLMASRYASVDDLEEKHFKLFGFKPSHPADGTWQWDGQNLGSSSYGGIWVQKQPGYPEAGTVPGLLAGFDNLSLNMQFEDSGLRAVLHWKKK
jgi:hypothetical protein